MAIKGWNNDNYLYRNGVIWPGQEPFLAVVWGYREPEAGWARAFTLAKELGEGRHYRSVGVDSSNSRVEIRDSGASAISTSVSGVADNTWQQHAGYFRDSTFRRIYLDSAFSTSTDVSINPDPPTETILGRRQTSGIFDENMWWGALSVWDTDGMSDEQVTSLVEHLSTAVGGVYPNPRNVNMESGEPWEGKLVAWIPMTDTDALEDETGNGHDLTEIGTLNGDSNHHPAIASFGPTPPTTSSAGIRGPQIRELSVDLDRLAPSGAATDDIIQFDGTQWRTSSAVFAEVQRATSDQDVTASNTVVQFNSVIHDDHSLWNQSEHRFEITRKGLYLFTGSVRSGDHNTTGDFVCFSSLTKNGTSTPDDVVITSARDNIRVDTDYEHTMSGMVLLEEGDHIYTLLRSSGELRPLKVRADPATVLRLTLLREID